jgi:RNA polymerase sigma-70 factor (ECF subfamily)
VRQELAPGVGLHPAVDELDELCFTEARPARRHDDKLPRHSPPDARLPCPPVACEDGGRMDEWLRSALASAHAAWPTVVVTDDSFAAHLVAIGTACGSETAAADLVKHAGDLYLAYACARGDEAALSLFDDRYLSEVAGHVRRVVADQDTVEEVLQELRIRLLLGDHARIRQYAGQGSLLGWVKAVAVHQAIDLARRRRPVESANDAKQDPDMVADRDPELRYIRDHHRADFRAALHDALATLSLDERNLLRFYLLDQLNTGEIANIFGTHRTTVGRWIHQARGKLLKATRTRLRERFGASKSEIDSLLRLFDSELNISLVDYLEAG